MNISNKLHVSALQTECLTFLLSHAAGRPIKAMRIAELFEEEELYRESSRFVLDNPGGWSDEELGTLSQATLLKLEKRSAYLYFISIRVAIDGVTGERGFSSGYSSLGWFRSPKNTNAYVRTSHTVTVELMSDLILSAVFVVPRSNKLRTPPRREVETSLSSRLSLR